jgi:hypothetical protein
MRQWRINRDKEKEEIQLRKQRENEERENLNYTYKGRNFDQAKYEVSLKHRAEREQWKVEQGNKKAEYQRNKQ